MKNIRNRDTNYRFYRHHWISCASTSGARELTEIACDIGLNAGPFSEKRRFLAYHDCCQRMFERECGVVFDENR